jgi:hypothetical protein
MPAFEPLRTTLIDAGLLRPVTADEPTPRRNYAAPVLELDDAGRGAARRAMLRPCSAATEEALLARLLEIRERVARRRRGR